MFRAAGKLLHWVWSGLDGLRKVLHLVLLLVLFGTLWAAFSRSIPLVPDKAALVIAPQGPLVEQFTGDPLERAVADGCRLTACRCQLDHRGQPVHRADDPGPQSPLSFLTSAAPVSNSSCASSRMTREVRSSIFACCAFNASA